MRVLVVAAAAAEAGVTTLVEGVRGVELLRGLRPAEALDEVARLMPDAVVIHVEADDDIALTVIETLAAHHDPVPVLALLDGAAAEEALLAGAGGALPISVDEAAFSSALDAIVQGLSVVGRGELRRLLAPEAAPAGLDLPVERLTARESEVLQLLALGLTNAEIAGRLTISAHTAKFHVGSVLGKLGARSRADAVARAARLGWIIV